MCQDKTFSQGPNKETVAQTTSSLSDVVHPSPEVYIYASII